ncbi:MAG TPA: preprotein translocase subunit YajC [Deltaproteobacteria bacterium]|nr:preprotein translocase subunit YajC [Deltaproteobacteria bacterium]
MIDLAYAMGGQATGGQGAGLLQIAPFILLFVVFYFLLIRPQQKKAKQHKAFLDGLKKGDTVVTSGGIYGKITGITDDAVTMEIAEKVRIRVLKGAVADYVKGEQA